MARDSSTKVDQFIEKMTRDDQQDNTFDEVIVNEGSPMADKNLMEVNIRSKYEVHIVVPSNGNIVFNPKVPTIKAGDSLVILGESVVLIISERKVTIKEASRTCSKNYKSILN